MKKLLLHTCCAPCASGCIERLLEEKREIVLFFSNSNIATETEFEKRLGSVRKFASVFSLELIVDPYRHQDWLAHVSAVEDFAQQPERGKRCTACFAWSLGRTAEKALDLDMNFTTTLTVSPHKNSDTIFRLCETDPRFEPYNFKKRDGFKRSLELSRELELYRQNFCGCEFSRRIESGKS